MQAGPDRESAIPRIASLDGLRGVACVLVLICHLCYAALRWSPALGDPQPTGSLRWWLSETPLHMVWAGPEMVIIFFVLSGYVLVGPAVVRGLAWFRLSYYPRRFIRLYVPAFAAVGLAVVIRGIPSFGVIPGASAWLNSFAVPVTFDRAAGATTLMLPIPSLMAITPALWTMRWEVLFSAVLPVALLLPYATRNRPALAALLAVGCFAVVGLVAPGPGWGTAPHYLATFELGSVMVFQIHRLPRIARTARLMSVLSLVVAVGLLTMSYWAAHTDGGTAHGIPEVGATLGACVVVWLAVSSEGPRAWLSAPACQWLGHRSYSLYLVHLPIVVTLACALGGKMSLLTLSVIAAPASLIGADLFFRCVERPATRLSVRAGRAQWVRVRPASPARASIS